MMQLEHEITQTTYFETRGFETVLYIKGNIGIINTCCSQNNRLKFKLKYNNV